MLILRQTTALTWRALMARTTPISIANDQRKFSSTRDDDSDSSSSDDEKQPVKKHKKMQNKEAKKDAINDFTRAKKDTKIIAAAVGVKNAPTATTTTTTTETNDALNEEATETAAERLNRILVEMKNDDKKTLEARHEEFPLPGAAIRKQKEEAKAAADAKNIFKAAERIAELLNVENKKQTESELLTRLLGRDPHQEITEEQTKGNIKKQKQKTVQQENMSLSELIGSMKILQTKETKEETRSDFVRRTLAAKTKQQQQQQQLQNLTYEERKQQMKSLTYEERRKLRKPIDQADRYAGSVNLMGGESMNIFTTATNLNDSPDILSTWSHLRARELQLLVTHPPKNYFEKIARWTEQGKVWRFPIDNEQDYIDENINVDFSEHIFLDQHLEDWCPNKGPIRHFMELVCVGLSKNPYITAREKKEHILWYRDYFEGKRDILKNWMDKEPIGIPNADVETKTLEA